jgi:hypothetical protein
MPLARLTGKIADVFLTIIFLTCGEVIIFQFFSAFYLSFVKESIENPILK